MRRWQIDRRRVLLLPTLWLAGGAGAAMQAPPPLSAWSGWARCQVDIEGPGYADHQTHTWTLTGGAPTVQGAFRIYAATWSDVGSGALQRTQGTQTLAAQWTTNVPAMSAPLALFVRASDGRMFLQARHAQLRAPAAIAGLQQVTIDGRAQPPGQIAVEAFEWAFPVIDGPSTAKSFTGSSTPAVTGSVGVMQPAGSRGTASCTWQFAEGSAVPGPPPTAATPPAATPPTASAVPPPAAAPPTMTAVALPPAIALATPNNTLPPPTPPTMTVIPLFPPLVASPPASAPPTGDTPAATRAIAPPVMTAPVDPYEPNNSASQARSLGDLKMKAEPLVIRGLFDTADDNDDWFTLRVVDDGTPPEASVLAYRDHHLAIGFVNPPYKIGDYPLYQITVTVPNVVTRESDVKMRPDVTAPWRKTTADDTHTFLIHLRRLSGQPSDGFYQLVFQAD